MQLRTKALDCLYLNWALPLDSAPELPPPLRYEVHSWQGGDYIFASALLFRLWRMRLEPLPFVKLSYPQMHCRVYVRDGDDMPAVLFREMLVPWWALPVARSLGRQPASPAAFSFPEPSHGVLRDEWRWSVRRQRSFKVTGRAGSPAPGPGPKLGDWTQTVDYFRSRPRGYVMWLGRLRPFGTSRSSVEVWPLEVDIHKTRLLDACLGRENAGRWQQPHSAWLCPEIPFLFELAEIRTLNLGRRRMTAAEGC